MNRRTTTITLTILTTLALLTAACGATDNADDALDGAAETEAAEDSGSGLEASDQVDSEAASEEEESAAEAPADAAGGGFFVDESADTAAQDGSSIAKEEPAEDSTFQDYGVRPFVSTSQDPLSTFALDVDTASYSVARQWVSEGVVPPAESVRVEEFVNSFNYDYRAPSDGLAVEAEAGPSPFDVNNVILRLGVQAEQVANADRPAASLTFVVDTSGSMDRSDRLALVKTSLNRLVTELEPADTVALVTYSDNAQVLLPPTSASDADTIIDAIDGLQPTGSTNLEAGLQTGYDLANESFEEGGINRVVLASDGVANVGLTDPDGLVSLIRGDADKGIHLVTVGVGMGNFNDVVMEQLANDGDGFYSYVNDQAEADRLFGDELVSTLLTVAIDGKIQVEFNTDIVSQYRLIGFENRAVLDEDFRNDEVDAGELGAGHQVTALYELTLVDGVTANDSLGTVQLRWQDPDAGDARENRLEVTGASVNDQWLSTSDDFRLAVTAGSLAEVLRGSPYIGNVTLQAVAEEAEAVSPGTGPVADLVDLVHQIQALS